MARLTPVHWKRLENLPDVGLLSDPDRIQALIPELLRTDSVDQARRLVETAASQR